MSDRNRLSIARSRRDAWLDALELVAVRREELEARLWLASLFHLDAMERAQLEADVHAFNAECFALTESLTAKQRCAA